MTYRDHLLGFAVVLCGMFAFAARPAEAADAPKWIAQLIRKLPETEAEVEAIWEKSRNASIQVTVGEPLQAPDFSQQTDYDVTVAGKKKQLKFDFARIGALNFGLAVSESDQAHLPAVSKGKIMERVDGNYISIQIRPHRDQQTGAIYLYYKPFAAIGAYGLPGAQEFSPLMEDSVADFRGVGLFVKRGTPITAEALRTFVGVNKTMITDEANPDAPQPKLVKNFEFTFVRARIAGDRVALHTFVTDGHRTRLHYLHPYEPPPAFADCDVQSVLLFTDYSVAKQSPSAKAIRHAKIRDRAMFPVADLDKWASGKGWSGGALDNLTELLDAIIDGQLSPTPSAAGGK